MKSWQIHSTVTTQVPTGRTEKTGGREEIAGDGMPVKAEVERQIMRDDIQHFKDFVAADDIHAAIAAVEKERPGCVVFVASPTNPGQATELLMATKAA